MQASNLVFGRQTESTERGHIAGDFLQQLVVFHKKLLKVCGLLLIKPVLPNKGNPKALQSVVNGDRPTGKMVRKTSPLS